MQQLATRAHSAGVVDELEEPELCRRRRQTPAARIDNAARQLERELSSSEHAELRRRGRALRECCRWWKVRLSSPAVPVPASFCRERLCPRCAAVRAREWIERLRPLLEETRAAGRRPKLVTLTVRSRPGEELRHARARLEGAFRRFYRSKEFRARVRAWCASREVTWTGTAWHYHLHMIADADYWPHEELSESWRRASGDSFIVDIREAKEGTETEVVKYALKVLTFPRSSLLEVVRSLHRARMVSCGGAWRGRVKDADLELALEDSPELVEPVELADRAARGEPLAQRALADVFKWLEARAGVRAAHWLTSALQVRRRRIVRGLGSPFDLIPGARALELELERLGLLVYRLSPR